MKEHLDTPNNEVHQDSFESELMSVEVVEAMECETRTGTTCGDYNL